MFSSKLTQADHQCPMCPVTNSNKKQHNRHKLDCHSLSSQKCECGKEVSRTDALLRHMETHSRKKHVAVAHMCRHCDKSFTTSRARERHEIERHVRPESAKICSRCDKKYKRPEHLARHMIHAHVDQTPQHAPGYSAPESTAGAKTIAIDYPSTSTQNDLQLIQTVQYRDDLSKLVHACIPEIWTPPQVITDDPLAFNPIFVSDFDQHTATLFRINWPLIRTKLDRKRRLLKRTYNFRLPQGFGYSYLSEIVNFVFEDHKTIFKANFAFGLVLRHRITGELSYKYTEKNNAVLQQPMLIRTKQDITELISLVIEFDHQDYALKHRPDTQNELHMITNVTIFTYPMGLLPIGRPSDDEFCAAEATEQDHQIEQNQKIKQFIHNSKRIYSLSHDRHGRKYRDNLCFFRCLASEISGKRHVTEREVSSLYEKWTVYNKQHGWPVCAPKEFVGVDILRDVSNLEDCFEINIFVYTLTLKTEPFVEEEGDIYDILAEEEIAKEMGIERGETHDESGMVTAQLLVRSIKMHNKSLHLNMNFDHFSRITDISHYAKYWRCEMCNRIILRKDNYMNHLRVCNGAIRKIYPGGGFGNRLNVFEKLADEGIDVSLEDRFYPYRAVFDFECRFEELPDSEGNLFEKRLIPVSVSVMSNIPDHTVPTCLVEEDPNDLIRKFYNLLQTMARQAEDVLKTKYAEVTQKIAQKTENLEHVRGLVQELRRSEGPTDQIEKLQEQIRENVYWDQISAEWKKWTQLLPTVGFNSAKFDLNLIKRYLIPIILAEGFEISAIKRGASYLLLTAGNIMFMDISNFLAQGTSYAAWLVGFGVKETKGVFPYEWLTDFRLLEQDHLPSKESFFSTLRQCGISDEDYQSLQHTWTQEGFGSMKDMLVWYNNKDVGPFMMALEKMWEIFKEMNIDMLKSGCISLPGLAQAHMFNGMRPDVIFQIFNEDNREYRDLLHANIVGGPAIIFKRKAVAGAGAIKGMGPPPGAIVGYDANGLYSWSLAQEMPTGIGIKWEPRGKAGEYIPGFKGIESVESCLKKLDLNKEMQYHPKTTSRGQEEIIAVNLVFKMLENQYSDKKLTLRHRFNGKQKIFRFGRRRLPVDGWVPELRTIIQYHGCYFHGHDCKLTKKMDPRQKQLNLERTQMVTGLLRKTGCVILEMTQCEFYAIKKTEPWIANYAAGFSKNLTREDLSMKQIVNKIQSGNFFGMVEVDIQVPFWDEHLRQEMEEFPPIFKNTEVSIEDIGEHMKDFATSNNLMKKPRRALIGSYFADKMLIGTPLLQWYLDHGLVITRIHRALQYVPLRAFKHLPEEVADHRRRADQDPNLAAYGLLFKLMGNSYYGKCLTDKEKHMTVRYEHRHDAAVSVCSPYFRKLEIISEDVYETHLAKSRVVFDLPINIAYFVYTYAKLRMLQFYYDFLKKVIKNENFELLEMDTDSLYLAVAGEDLEKTVDYKNTFETLKPEFLVCNDYDKKTPGLFKLEWSGKGMISLCPKTYIAFDDDDDTNIKLSTKGLAKKTNTISVSDFANVLHSRTPVSGTNRGFRTHKFDLCQYEQQRQGLTYLYVKRKIDADGIGTKPLDI